MPQLQQSSSLATILAQLKREGLTFEDCISAFAENGENPFIESARQQCGGADSPSIDSATIASRGNDGAWVMAWLWIDNASAGVVRPSELFDDVWLYATKRLDDMDRQGTTVCSEHAEWIDWVEFMVSAYASDLDCIDTTTPTRPPGPIDWTGNEGRTIRFFPSDALNQALVLAREGGLSIKILQKAQDFCTTYGQTINAILTNVTPT